MLSWKKEGEVGYMLGWCLSTDTKPTAGIKNGSCLIEMDTGAVYFFDEEGAQWVAFE